MKTVHIVVNPPNEPLRSDFRMGGKNPAGVEIAANSAYFTRAGQPWFPIMGEIHYSRYPRADWEEALLKMRAGGIDIIAAYLFWIHHEELEGELAWQGNLDVRHFVELCAKHAYPILLRLGPWCHGECRNGGLPDWLLQKDFTPRTNDDRYFSYARRWYAAIYQQIQGLLYKDGGPIIGVQIENEYGHCGGLQGAAGKQHIAALKQLAQEIGFDVPFYTATGWGGAIVLEDDMLPVFAAYPDLPWTQHTNPLPPNIGYLFSASRDDFQVGTDLAQGEPPHLSYTPEKYPFALAELGPGTQCTYHRRAIVTAADAEAFVLAKLGSGANLLGYYMFHGGSHPLGKRSTMQESRATGYLNDLPVISYDFQTAIREYGQISAKYRYLKILHLFLHDFGAELAQTQVTLPPTNATDATDAAALRVAVRDHNGAGFLFLNNYQKNLTMLPKEDYVLRLAAGGETVAFPPLTLASGRYCILPYNLHLGDLRLASATAQPLCRLSQQGEDYYFFFAYPELEPRYVFAKTGVATIDSPLAAIAEDAAHFTVRVAHPGLASVITLRSSTGQTVHLVTLTRTQAENCWKAELWGRERLIISTGDVTWAAETMQVCFTETTSISVAFFPAVEHGLRANGQELSPVQEGLFTTYTWQQAQREIAVAVRELNACEETESAAFVPLSAREFNPCDQPWRQWEISIPAEALTGLHDIFLRIDFDGDIAQLFLDKTLESDWFYNGEIWEVGLKRFADRLRRQPLRLQISPLAADHRIYLEKQPTYTQGIALQLNQVRAIPQYQILITQVK